MLERASQSNLFRNRNQVKPLTQEEIDALIEENRRRNEREENTEEFNPTNFIDTLNNNRNRRRQLSPQELLQRRRLNQPIPTREEEVEQQGHNGCTSETYIIKKLNGATVSTEEITSDYYHALDKIIKKGIKR